MDPKDICVLVSYNEFYADMASLTVEHNIKKYCKMHGYTLWEDKQETTNEYQRSSQWQKIKVSIDVLKNNNFKWLFFIDLDCLIMNSDIKLESIIDDNYAFIVPAHNMKPIDTPVVGHNVENIITSQYLVKNNEDGLAILEDIWEAKGHPENIDINSFDYEGRQARITISKPEFKDKIKIIEERILNRFWYVNNPFMTFHFKGVNDLVWQPGDFIVHVTGYKKEDRIKLLSDLNYFSKLNHGYE
jgi:hypothetical protein